MQGYPDKIMDGKTPEKGNLYLGALESIKGQVLSDLMINAVISVMEDCPFRLKDKQQLIINIHDHPNAKINQHFCKAFKFITENLDKTNVLVHCMGGVSRSATIVIGFLIFKYRILADDALIYVQSRRPVVGPNLGFIKQLKQYEQVIRQQLIFDKLVDQHQFIDKVITSEGEFGNIYIGGRKSLAPQILQSYKINRIITLVDDKKLIDDQYMQLQFEIQDNEHAQISKLFDQTNSFINQNLLQSNILIVSEAGVSRAPTILMAYLINKEQWNLDQCMSHVKGIRNCVWPNSGFMEQLKQYLISQQQQQ